MHQASRHRFLGCLFIVSIGIQSCTYFTEPKPFSNKDLSPQETRPLILPNLQNGDTVTGTIAVELEATDLLSQIDYVTVWNDSTTFPRIAQPPFQFTIDTRWWLNGSRDLAIGLYKKNYNVGLIRINNEPSVKYIIHLVFKHKPLPPQVSGTARRTTLADSADVRWRQNLADDVQYYIIQFFRVSFPVDTAHPFLSDTLRSNHADHYVTPIQRDVIYVRVGAGNQDGPTYSDFTYLIGTN